MKTATVTLLAAHGAFSKVTFTLAIDGVTICTQFVLIMVPSRYLTNDTEFDCLQATLRNWQTLAEAEGAIFSTSAEVVALVETLSK